MIKSCCITLCFLWFSCVPRGACASLGLFSSFLGFALGFSQENVGKVEKICVVLCFFFAFLGFFLAFLKETDGDHEMDGDQENAGDQSKT